MKRNRILLIIALVLAFAMAFSVFSIFLEIGHACCCDNELCQFCALLSSNNKGEFFFVSSASLFFTACAFLCVAFSLAFVIITKPSPIKLRVKLSN
ncbi:MAG: hypothetical protein IJD42_06085 [Clostridia bacterium]|nr:hypothetical protein [Clostridia bacterium]